MVTGEVTESLTINKEERNMKGIKIAVVVTGTVVGLAAAGIGGAIAGVKTVLGCSAKEAAKKLQDALDKKEEQPTAEEIKNE